MAADRDYVLGTHDEELIRLGLQHRVWRHRALAAWQRAGITVGSSVVDIGSGPGYASVDLAEIVGPEGKVIALERSRRFLDFLEATSRARGLTNIRAIETDLDLAELPAANADAAWARWVFAFVHDPRRLLARVAAVLKPGGVFVAHEYYEYKTWRMIPRSVEHEEFVDAVTTRWRADGGEPDIGRDLLLWLQELNFDLIVTQSFIEVIHPGDFFWQWPKAFIASGLSRLVDLGTLTRDRASAIAAAFEKTQANPHAQMITPAVLEIIAVKR